MNNIRPKKQHRQYIKAGDKEEAIFLAVIDRRVKVIELSKGQTNDKIQYAMKRLKELRDK